MQILFELPWSSHQAMQQLGRTHRSRQRHPPAYVVLVADFGPELRFGATVASRLKELGAISSGDRNAIGEGAGIAIEGVRGMDADVFVSKSGTTAAKDVTRTGPLKALRADYGLANVANGRQLLNRLLVVPIEAARELFDAFVVETERVHDEALRRGRASEAANLELTHDERMC